MKRIADADRALHSRSRLAALAAVATAAVSLALTLPSQVVRLAETPPGRLDGRDYDHLALNLARGRGFGYCWSDPEWRGPYERAENRTAYASHLALWGPCMPTARRAPGYPAALAIVYRVWGRSFLAGRLLSAVALATTGALGVVLAVRAAGPAAGVLFALCFLIDGQLRQLVGGYMSEPTASLAVMAVLAAHVTLLRNPTRERGMVAGSLLGLLVLIRHHFSPLWTLGILGATLGAVRSRPARPAWVAHGSAALLVLVPWCVRNCLVLDAPMPLGTQGGQVLAATYVDGEAGAVDGRWNSAQAARLWARRKGRPIGYTYDDLAREMRSSLAVDREFAMMGQEAAREWLRRNWRRLPAAAFVTLRAHVKEYGALGLTALLCGLAALAFPGTRRVAALGFVIMAATALTVVLTFTHPRFVAPMRPVAYLLGSLGLTASASWLWHARRWPLVR
jgi:hypothetical protein